MAPETGSAHIRRLLHIRRQVEEKVRVAKRIGVRLPVWRVLEVDVLNKLRVVVVWTRYDELVEIDDDSVPVAIDIAHHAVIEWCWAGQLHRVQNRRRYLQCKKKQTDFPRLLVVKTDAARSLQASVCSFLSLFHIYMARDQ